MAPMSPLRRRAPWVAGALLLALVGFPVLGLGLRLGLADSWPFLVGGVALLLLLAGWVERTWQSRPLNRPKTRSAGRSRFRVLPGGRSEDRPMDLEDDDNDKPRWLM